jgi:hypothetical protein
METRRWKKKKTIAGGNGDAREELFSAISRSA